MSETLQVGRQRSGVLVKRKRAPAAPVTKLEIDWAGENVKAIGDGRHVTELVCHATYFSGERLCELLRKLGNGVEVIDLNGSNFEDSVLNVITAHNFTHLRVFRAGDCNFSYEALIGFLKERGATLDELDLSGVDFMPQQLSEISKLTPNLMRINVSRTVWDSSALKIAFQDRWTALDRLEARGCKGFSFDKIEFWPAMCKLSYLDVRGTAVADSKALVEALSSYMTHMLLSEITPQAVQGLMKKPPTVALGITSKVDWQLFQSLFKTKDISQLYLTNCSKLGGRFFQELEGWPLQVLSVAATGIRDKHLERVNIGELIEIDLSHCNNLKGEYRGWDLRSAKRIRLAGLKWIDDSVIDDFKWPDALDELVLEGTSFTLKGVVKLLGQCEIKRLVFPSKGEFVIESGKGWSDADLLSLLPHLSLDLTAVHLSNFRDINVESWTTFVERLPESVIELTVEGCARFGVIQLEIAVARLKKLSSITLSSLSITKLEAFNALKGVKATKNLSLSQHKASAEEQSLSLAIERFNDGDFGSAVKTFDAHQKTSPRAQCWLGIALYEGKGVDQDKKEGRNLIIAAASKMIVEAQIYYGRILCEEGDLTGGVGWLDKQVAGWNYEAMYWKAYYQLKENPKDAEANNLLELAASSGNKEAIELKEERAEAMRKDRSSLSDVVGKLGKSLKNIKIRPKRSGTKKK